MNVLRFAQHRAGMHFAFNKVLKLLLVVMLLDYCLILYLNHLGHADDTKWLFVTLVVIGCSAPLEMVFGYFIARHNPKCIRRELEGIILHEKKTIARCWFGPKKPLKKDSWGIAREARMLLR